MSRWGALACAVVGWAFTLLGLRLHGVTPLVLLSLALSVGLSAVLSTYWRRLRRD